ncbi:PAS and helix-turn-helix domain-containing protein [Crateriforma conspicua]|uniref:Oxygen regulatory protein NreC n=1 Tax=Crateriforma conspicua TaxID=2527996 RepID=A0A5C6FTC6_9PLAN|nr:PAS and helix-turn-helix domain-containing protein [Crateriforma conspicua]TWU64758.1 Oxygen regulatory protein NreC [Crateriforma conspicua]
MNDPQPALQLWSVLTNLPGVGVSLMDDRGGLLFVNDVSMEMFFVDPTVDYRGKCIADFHNEDFVTERLALIRRVLDEQKPIRFRHIYKARHLESKIWPLTKLIAPDDEGLRAATAPHCGEQQSGDDRAADPSFDSHVLVVTQEVDPSDLGTPASSGDPAEPQDGQTSESKNSEETILNSNFIDLGPLNVLSPRELEVLVLLGHGLSVPDVAKYLFRSPKTIERHKTSIGHKLHLQGQVAMTRLVTQVGLDLKHAALKRLGESE